MEESGIDTKPSLWQRIFGKKTTPSPLPKVPEIIAPVLPPPESVITPQVELKHEKMTERELRKKLMDDYRSKMTPEQIEELKKCILPFSAENINAIINMPGKKPGFTPYKFVREGDRIILFPIIENDKNMHIHYAIADGMQNPDDGGNLFIYNDKINLNGTSSSLQINPRENPERPKSVELVKVNLPAGMTLKEGF